MGQIFTQVDAFTKLPFKGNPAAVCVLDQIRDDGWMQNVAREFNLSETAFLKKIDGGYNLRWFTPANEVDLCGHATLSSAHVLWESGLESEEAEIVFHTKSGKLSAVKLNNWIKMNFPSTPIETEVDLPEISELLGAEVKFVGKSKFDYLIEVESEEVLRSLSPNLSEMKKIETRGFIITAKSKNYDFVSRFFAPKYKVDEDPVTGSAHCTLAPYWRSKLGKKEMSAYQVSSRGGEVRVVSLNDRVDLLGQAVTVLKGELLQD